MPEYPPPNNTDEEVVIFLCDPNNVEDCTFVIEQSEADHLITVHGWVVIPECIYDYLTAV